MKYVYLLSAIVVFVSCQRHPGSGYENSTDAGKAAVINQRIDDMYGIYEKSALGWVDFYQDTFTVLTRTGQTKTFIAQDMRNQWENIYSKDTVILVSHSQPVIKASGNLAVHWNHAHEIIISKETGDTLRDNSGLWMAVWEKQDDGSWKIAMETYQAND